MTQTTVQRDAPLDDEVAAAETACLHTLETDYFDLLDRLPAAASDPEACFELLSGIPYDRKRVAALRHLKADAERAGITTPYAIERLVVLQSYLVALPRLRSLPVDKSVNREYCITCRRLASPQHAQDSRLAHDRDPFTELAQIVTLRRFHAGQSSFDITNMARAWLLKAHPIELPGLIREIMFGIGGFGPVVMPHLNYWRQNPMFILKGEHERAHWRIAKCMERNSHVKGFIASSWLYSAAVGEHIPSLGWVRDFFVDQNAYIIDLGPALVDSGFLVGSEKLRQLYAEGKFHPPETLVLWRRAEMIAWANRHPELGERARPRNAPLSDAGASQRLPAARKSYPVRALRSGRFTLIDCKRLLFYRSRYYIALVLLLPALCAAILASIFWTVAAGCLAFAFAIFVMWMLQYFFLQ